MKNKLLLILLFGTLQVFSQINTRELLKGQVQIDSMDVENITILNTATHVKTNTGKMGEFEIYARVKDTLVFSSLSFSPLMIVLEKRDFDMQILRIRLTVEVNQLNEVIVKRLSGDLERDTRKLKDRSQRIAVSEKILFDTDFKTDYLTRPTTPPIIPNMSPLMGVDFIKVGEMVGRLFKSTRKKDTGTATFVTDKIFADAVREKLSNKFFADVLKFKKEEIGPFLTYCDQGTITRELLEPQHEFELIDYLISKSKTYRQQQKK
ncbi:carboxypeptidase-like regulatory domain-containing protein [Flavobacterium cerinum]|uniref:Carboxypeptidase-like regulatory domain-containing protein n=1 Tax=Flavobacterium cerinum TaxID=2502784 RepID=A0ABY5ISG7_9FLAO|nr:carboxypeptidase-like regulatory domain-containing protein [Flavobacterium cerinum]UUC45796.1 carboxypeptidase-like regulatory domain-containing protein [Flavobacterium cerinum]